MADIACAKPPLGTAERALRAIPVARGLRYDNEQRSTRMFPELSLGYARANPCAFAFLPAHRFCLQPTRNVNFCVVVCRHITPALYHACIPAGVHTCRLATLLGFRLFPDEIQYFYVFLRGYRKVLHSVKCPNRNCQGTSKAATVDTINPQVRAQKTDLLTTHTIQRTSPLSV